jgi:acetolactate synthase-1/2/3 large subunit
MFPGLTSVDVADVGGLAAALRASLDIDGPSVLSIECAADEMPPFAPFLAEIPTMKENRTHVPASA